MKINNSSLINNIKALLALPLNHFDYNHLQDNILQANRLLLTHSKHDILTEPIIDYLACTCYDPHCWNIQLVFIIKKYFRLLTYKKTIYDKSSYFRLLDHYFFGRSSDVIVASLVYRYTEQLIFKFVSDNDYILDILNQIDSSLQQQIQGTKELASASAVDTTVINALNKKFPKDGFNMLIYK